MVYSWTPVQKQRLKELNADEEQQEMLFENNEKRDRAFQELEQKLVKKGKERLQGLKDERKRPALSILESKLVDALTKEGFVQVVTPIILAKGSLAKMSIHDEHPLFSQVFWLDEKKCLRPMLAPNLYALWRELLRLWEKPIRIFEVGSCFRKESQGAHHLNEFTMLNVTELGLPLEKRQTWLEEMAALVMETAGIDHYDLVSETSVVYGDTVDVVAGIELGSGAMGPHPLDDNWGIIDPWAGIGFGLERLLMVREGGQNIQRMAKSITYLDGVRLNI
ncbi:pyrrolysine--tRNA(Pyl) ligase large subunit [Candidatus Formimonas warabiya]|uniref:Pyrrolysine--tRNA(Pyl) ligase large subunit n=1 Tax=Formimonas warabiya TaxID=1761012 RepID=A0A3G1L0C3_FORW1|nr:pyrrolysine--tRNA(Pyl) ligase large subunit [Candidatus Formimonas warabiya]ATW28107.1 pyrrolysine--tRNA(Pyl) ligase large subunit [Candidatus Formimonas warabiya]